MTTRAADVIKRAATNEALDAVQMLESEITEAQTSDEAHALGMLAVQLEQRFAAVAQAAAERAEWWLKIESRRQK